MSTSKTALVTGASGLLGRDVVKEFERAGWRVIGTGLTRVDPPSLIKLDLLNEEDIVKVLDDVKPDVIVHCAANRFPDSVEKDPSAATALNVSSTSTLATQARDRGILLLYISTDYVFSGKPGEAPYEVSDTRSPPNAYGRTKAEGEEAVLDATKDGQGKISGVILRVPVLYGHCEDGDKSKSAVHAVLDAVHKSKNDSSGPKIKVDHYALRYPTATEDVARVCKDIAQLYTADKSEKQLPQILQFSAEEKFTKYEMAKLFAEDILAVPVDGLEPHDPTKDEAEAAGTTQRPYDSHLSTKALQELGISVAACDFKAWWRRELRAFRH